jgi:excisionase family DNA binding protein
MTGQQKEYGKAGPGHPPRRQPKAFSIKEFAAMLGVNQRSVYREIADGKIRTFKFRGSTRIPVSELERITGDKYHKGGAA